MKNFDNGALKIVLRKEGNDIIMSWIGQSDERNPAALLNPYLDSVIRDFQGKGVTIEYETLEYMNSLTVPSIIQFLKKLDINGISTVVTYDAESKWQRASFKAIETLSLMMRNIRVKGR
ncbi:MAG: hypothetical protein GY749_38855 [Desulfobacteraceae bacterium]|nr:hypothetical protein [Desulfobacteraceae bacterium]